MKTKLLFWTLMFLILTGAGCNQSISVPHIAESLGPADQVGAPAQNQGFGELPKIQWPDTPEQPGVTNFKTDLPTLQSTINVLRLPAGNLKLSEFQNLTQAIGLPAGLIGNETKNLGYTIDWTNQEGINWHFASNERKLTFNNPQSKPQTLGQTMIQQTQLLDMVDHFLNLHGIDERKLRYIQIIPRWQPWLIRLDQIKGCVPAEVKSAMANFMDSQDLFHEALPALPEKITKDCFIAYPNLIPISFERLVDGQNIVDKAGQPEYGGQILVNAQTGQLVSGWMTLPAEPQRSDYPAITKDQMQNLLAGGGLAGPLPGIKEITGSSFAFVRLPKTQASDFEYLVPALVAEATHDTDKGPEKYKIIVPLLKP